MRDYYSALRAIIAVLVVVSGIVGMVDEAPAQQITRSLMQAPGVELEGPARGGVRAAGAALQRSSTIVRSRLADVDFSLLGGDTAPLADPQEWRPGTMFELNLFDNARYLAVLEQAGRNLSGSYNWVGHLASDPLSTVSMVIANGTLSASISTPGGVYQIRPVSGTHIVHQIDPEAFPAEAEAVPIESGGGERLAAAASTTGAVRAPTAADDGSRLDVLVLWTPAARAAAGGTVAMEALAELAVTDTNASYANSGITTSLRLVHRQEVAYTEPSNNAFGNALSQLQSTSDGILNEAHTLRDAYGADVVQLLIDDNQYCGIAYVMMNESSGFDRWAFGVTAWDCAVGNQSFAHEIGHNQGAHHDHYVSSPPSIFPYSFGFVHIGPTRTSSFRTIMSYGNHCVSVFGAYCPRISHFSNPVVNVAGSPTGVPAGAVNPADNAQTINNTADTIAAFRAEVVSPPPGAVSPSAPSGAVANGSPTYEWVGVAAATEYELRITGGGGAVVFQQVFSASDAGCPAAGACSVTLGGSLGAGAYAWSVRARNANGNGAWSSALAFTVPNLVPDQPTPTTPTGSLNNGALDFSWQPVIGATDYDLEVSIQGGAAVVQNSYTTGEAGCASGGTCSTGTLPALQPGAYDWRVRARNAIGASAWSTPLSFTVEAPTPALVFPAGAIQSSSPTYSWNAVDGASVYHFWLYGPSGVTMYQGWFAAADLGCTGGGTCSMSLGGALGAGGYTWYVRASDGANHGAWSQPLDFSVTPLAPTLVGPTGVASSPPTFTWNASAGATGYQLWMHGSAGTLVYQGWFTAQQLGCAGGGTCSVTLGGTLGPGAYMWWVRPAAGGAPGLWSMPLAFVIF